MHQWSNKVWRAASVYVQGIARTVRALWRFAPFPNPHVRTNGFIMSRQVIDQIDWPRAISKRWAYGLESGRRGFTRQVIRMGLEPVVVGKNGHGYLRGDWPSSGTFWQGNQANLLIQDNQTMQYELGSADLKRRLCRSAWHHMSVPGI
jgi:hypothetical protein